MQKRYYFESAVLSLAIVIGLLGLSISAYCTAKFLRASNQTVTVKGLAEQDVAADLVIWPISFKEASNDLLVLDKVIQSKTALILAFLNEQGIDQKNISNSVPQIIDAQATPYYNANQIKFRYSAKTTLTVYSDKVEEVRQALQNTRRLIEKGIALSSDYEDKIQFLYTKLNDIKPSMIEQATKNARQAANQFAKDSNSHLGNIKRASQGQFSINDRDANSPYIKKVRVVTTLEYFLKH